MALSNTATPIYYGRFREAVMRGEIPVCREISMEMNRIDDLIANPGVYYDDKAVNGFIKFCERELTLTDGSDLKLLDSFKLWAEEIFGWYYFVERSVYVPEPGGHGGHYERKRIKKRLITKQYLIITRAAAKTMYLECLQAYFMTVDKSTTQQVTTAPTMKQAEEVLSPFRTALARARGPVFKFMTMGSIQNTTGAKSDRVKMASTKKGIENFLTGSLLEIRPMTIEKLQGRRDRVATVDEWLSCDIREDPIGAIEQGAAKNEDYLIVAASSEGTVRNGCGDTIKMELMEILKGEYVNPHVSIFYYKLDSIDEVGKPEMWLKANPNLGQTVSYETYQLDVERAENSPGARNDMAVAKKMNPKLVQGFSDLFGLYMKDGASETVAAATNTVVAAMSGDWASAVASGLTAVLDVVGTDFGQTLTEAISTALKNAFSGNGLFAQLLTKLFGSIDLGGSGSSGGFLSNLWQWLKGGASAAKSFLGGASTAAAGASGATKLIPVLNSVGTATANVASGVTTVAKAAGVAKAAATTAGAATSGVLAKVGMGVAKVASGLGPHGLLAAAVIAGTVAVGTAVVKNWDKVKEAVGNAWSWIKEKASGLWDGMKSIGGNLMSGLATGVKSAAKFGLKVALGPAYAIISGFKHILGIHSPSKVMAGIGEYVIEGLTRGIVSTEGEAEKGMDEVGGAVIRSALATTNAIADYLSTDNHPSITPVVDLSDAARGSAWLNSAFADRKGTISMAATVTGRMARRAETPSRNQNGYETAPAQTQSNRDVVEAVKTLGERIDRVAESVKGMKVVMNGRKFVGEIRSDIDDVVGDIIEKGH